MSVDLRVATPVNAKKTVAAAGTAEKISATELIARRVTIRALSTNTGLVAIGGSNTKAAAANANAVFLSATSDPLVLTRVDLSAWYVDAAVNGEGIVYTAELA